MATPLIAGQQQLLWTWSVCAMAMFVFCLNVESAGLSTDMINNSPICLRLCLIKAQWLAQQDSWMHGTVPLILDCISMATLVYAYGPTIKFWPILNILKLSIFFCSSGIDTDYIWKLVQLWVWWHRNWWAWSINMGVAVKFSCAHCTQTVQHPPT